MLIELIEPSNAERAQWPDATRAYVEALEAAVQEAPLTRSDMIEALDCVWNAAIGEAQRRQSGIDFAAILAEAAQSMSRRLTERAEAGQ